MNKSLWTVNISSNCVEIIKPDAILVSYFYMAPVNDGMTACSAHNRAKTHSAYAICRLVSSGGNSILTVYVL